MEPKSIDWAGLEEPQEIAHEFEIDLHNAVIANHNAMLEGIDREEESELLDIKDGFRLEDHETVGSMLGYVQSGYDERRQKGRLSAVVVIVTRLEQWISRFATHLKVKPARVKKNGLANLIEALNNVLGDGPVPTEFFEDLAELRHSVVHANSRAEWNFKGQRRRVADCYRNSWDDAELSEEQLKEAIQKTIEHVKWYDEKIQAKPALCP